DFYQYWRNVGDADVDKCLKMLTFLPIEELLEMEKWDDSRINEKKEILAYELTALVHGEEEAAKAKETARSLFAGGGNLENMPTAELSEDQVPDDGILINDLLVAAGLAASKSEARRLVQQGGVSVEDEKVPDIEFKVEKAALKEGVVVKKGKKVFKRVVIS
ncbi:MAG: tyrosine--tRNA ligase, partial [Lachnospiraceae bacterium]|nr:tyrosine--tRNA ligase [Lachnospiraceae bacterium]